MLYRKESVPIKTRQLFGMEKDALLDLCFFFSPIFFLSAIVIKAVEQLVFKFLGQDHCTWVLLRQSNMCQIYTLAWTTAELELVQQFPACEPFHSCFILFFFPLPCAPIHSFFFFSNSSFLFTFS